MSLLVELEKKIQKRKAHWIRKKNPGVSSLATKTALTAVENKVPDVNGSVIKRNYNKKNQWNWKKVYCS